MNRSLGLMCMLLTASQRDDGPNGLRRHTSRGCMWRVHLRSARFAQPPQAHVARCTGRSGRAESGDRRQASCGGTVASPIKHHSCARNQSVYNSERLPSALHTRRWGGLLGHARKRGVRRNSRFEKRITSEVTSGFYLLELLMTGLDYTNKCTHTHTHTHARTQTHTYPHEHTRTYTDAQLRLLTPLAQSRQPPAGCARSTHRQVHHRRRRRLAFVTVAPKTHPPRRAHQNHRCHYHHRHHRRHHHYRRRHRHRLLAALEPPRTRPCRGRM
jgi:hypothetical protein